jgi:hypothetical protein
MICPECRSEFIDEISSCPDCGIPLVFHLPDESTENSEHKEHYNLVCVYNPINSQEVALIKMIMEREGIPYLIKNDPIHKVVLFSIQGPGNIELYVDEPYADATIKLLREELEHE